MASPVQSTDLLRLLRILAECSESDCTSTCCSRVGPMVHSLDSWSEDCSLEAKSSQIDTLYCRCNDDDALV
jgi:hypothetical protein